MKTCPECSKEYADDVNFCTQDGRVLIGPDAGLSRLCPFCGNRVAPDAQHCSFCNGRLADPAGGGTVQYDEDREPQTLTGDIKRMPKSSKLLWVAGILLAALAGFFIGGYSQRRDLMQSMQEQFKDVAAKDRQIVSLKAQVAQMRQESVDGNKQVIELKAKIEEREKTLAAAQQKLAIASRDAERLTALKAAASTKANQPEASVVRSTEPGSYETVRYTTVHQEPVNSSRVVSQIEKGTRITVVRAAGEWLEVRSKQGNPPGFVRRDDVIMISRAN